jgi:periplasmic protein TonB
MEGPARGLALALAASAALHAAVLLLAAPDSPRKQHVVRLEPLVARLAEPESVVPPVAEKKLIEKKPARQPVIAVPEVPARAPEVEKAIPAERPAPVAAPVAVAVAVKPPSVPSAPDGTSVGQYRAQLLGAAGRFKRYPDAARERNWTGNVVVRVEVDARGAPEVGVRRSSGHAVLDDQALDMFRQAARAVPVPAPLKGTAFTVDVRAIYGLED